MELNRLAALAPALCCLMLKVMPVPAQAAGFAIDFESARAVGLATAGSSSASDASTIFYNAAGLGYLDHNEFIGGGMFLHLQDHFHNADSTIVGGALPTPGTNGQNAIPPSVVPWVFASYRFTPEIAVGLGVYSPFGLLTNYGTQFVGRYQNLVSSLTSINFNPTVSYSPVKWISFGFGLDVQYVNVRLTQAIDFGSICAAAIGLPTCSSGFGLSPGLSDGYADNHGQSYGAGFNVGILSEPVDGTRLGIAYRSAIVHHFGDAQQSFGVNPPARTFLAAAGTPLALTGSAISTTLPLPARLSFGIKQRLAPHLELLLDATLTFWDIFQSTSITAQNPVTGASTTIQQSYKNAWRLAAGLEYGIDSSWSVRGGAAYDWTPIPPAFVQAALPDRDRVYVSVGASYKISQRWTIDFGYSHLFLVGSVPINRTTSFGDTLNGKFNLSGDVFASQLKLEF